MNTDPWPFPGARWRKFDFHTHTPASSDYGSGANQAELRDRSHRDWIEDFLAAGIDCVAVTDHNCGDWIDPLKVELRKMQEEDVFGAVGFHLFPGVELTINGVHFLAIFDPSASTRTIQDLLAVARCNDTEQNAQAYCAASVSEICTEVQKRGGLFIPAHVDLDRTGMFKLQDNYSALDPILKLDGVLAMEVCDAAYEPPTSYRDAKLNWTSVLGSDAHHPQPPPAGASVPRPRFPGSHFTWVKMGSKPSIDALLLALVDGAGVSIRRSDEIAPGFDPHAVPDDLIEEIEIREARYMGHGTAEIFRFSPWLNALIGGRGSGKSTALQFLRLALRREDEILKLPADSLPRVEFERFRKVAQGRSDEGAITPETKTRLTYRHQGARYRIHWPQTEGGLGVEEWDASTGTWKLATSQEIRDRFPVRIFSQGQIAALAGEQSGALLRLVDEAVDFTSWKEQWDEKERAFLGLRNRIRELESKLESRDRIIGQLEDVRRKLDKFEKAEHAKVLRDYQARRRQEREVGQHSGEARTISDRLTALAEEIAPSDVPDGLFDSSDPLATRPLESVNRIRNAITAAAAAIEQVAQDLNVAAYTEYKELENSKWAAEVQKSKAAYDNLIKELQAQGVEDPSEYGTLVQDRQRLETEVKALDSIAETLQLRRQEGDEALASMQSLRRELSERREKFLREALAGNEYVRIELQRYGREPFAARDTLRELLGIDPNPIQFEADIYRPDETGDGPGEGLIADLLRDLPKTGAVEEMERRLTSIRSGLVKVATGSEFAKVSGHLRNRLRKSAEQRPEFVDRIFTWFPEDTLAVRYSPGGDGQEFRPIQQGSAGQRAAAMLAFLLAYGGEPIVVDQPEDDLDNHLIYRLVVQQIRTNKQRRQIIAVTHNPNIVVNGDAEMVHALDFVSGQCRVTQKGSLQDGPVRVEICRVMEGGEDAFEQRYRRIGKGARHV